MGEWSIHFIRQFLRYKIHNSQFTIDLLTNLIDISHIRY